MVLTLLFVTSNENKFSFTLDFRLLHKQIFSNCMRKLSIIDCFWFLHLSLPHPLYPEKFH